MMTWFVASIVSVIEIIDGEQEEFPIYEDFYLFEAQSEIELQDKIKSQMTLINTTGKCYLQGVPARQKCIGIRKIRSIYNDLPGHIDKDPPGDRSEVSHSFFVAFSREDVELFAAGHAVTLRCVDDAGEAQDYPCPDGGN
jgi:hypothetical protein